MQGQYGAPSAGSNQPRCARHPSEITYVCCQRCGKPTCPACQRPAAVGVHCVECAKRAGKNRRQPRTIAGAPLGTGDYPITKVIIGLCIAMHALGFVLPGVRNLFAFSPAVGYLQPWRFFTAAFLHVGLLHLLMNMLALWMLGQALEPLLGRWRYLALYVLSAIGGSVGLVLLVFNQLDFITPAVGASGAIFGLFGALFVLGKKAHTQLRSITVLIVLNMAYGFVVPGIAWQAHLGGLVVGAIVMWGLITAAQRRATWMAVATITVVSLVLVGASLAKYAALLS